jgi:ABC-type lipopolysaccharide export system ATPase subunit
MRVEKMTQAPLIMTPHYSEHRDTENLSAPHRRIEDIIRQGTTILLAEQNAAIALSVAGLGYVLETGSIALSGTAAELSERPDVKRIRLGERD